MSNTIRELIQPWLQRLLEQQLHQLHPQGEVQLQQQQLQYLLVTLLPQRERRLPQLVARPLQQQLQSLLMVVPQQLHMLRQLQVLPLLLLPPLILEHLQQRPQPQQQRLQEPPQEQSLQ
jgi:hypothetical protein